MAVVAGATSVAFWAAHEAARREVRDAVIADAGHTLDDAPRTLLLAAETIAQSMLIQQSAYARLAEAGGPLASSGRVRRAYTVWLTATDRLERHIKLTGLRRAPKPTVDLARTLSGLEDR